MRERISLDRGWRFALGHAANAALDFEFARDRALVKAGEGRGAASPAFDDSAWRQVDVPHDWAIELPLDPAGDKELAEHGFRAIGPDHPEHSIGWYRRSFQIPADDVSRRIALEFDGVFRDSIVWVNGHRMGRHASGYAPVRYDVTDVLNYGGDNVVAVRVDATSWEGWWYEGAGIYRHVWLVKTSRLHVQPDGICIRSTLRDDGSAAVTILTDLHNCDDAAVPFALRSSVEGVAGHTVEGTLAPWEQRTVEQAITIPQPRLWHCAEPNLYRLQTELRPGAGVAGIDRVTTTFGIRSLRWDAARGFFLNGQPVKIKGVCLHRDHAGVGVALPDRLHELRVEKVKAMGANAIRLSHYPAAPELLDACDRLGMLVMAENRLASSAPAPLADLETMIRRDRNHPSIILWSIGNEEHSIQWSIAGERIGRTLLRHAHRLDPTRAVTAAMHDRGLGEGFANVVDVHGWNYMNVGDIEAFHARRPDQPIIGSEEGSTVTTRGIYADDAERGYVRAYDQRAPKWGSTAEQWWQFFAERDWLAGAFVWTAFDYRGEPIPYKWPCTASHFGLMDLCGFPKDLYWYYKAWWSAEPVLHVFPHWNWPGREGQAIDVWCYANHEEVELLLNGRSLGRQTMPCNGHLAWTVPYAPGRLEARGFRGGACVQQCLRETTGPAAALVLQPDRQSIRADGVDVASITVSAIDAQGRAVPDAMNDVTFEIRGGGRLLGVGNGDPSSHEADTIPRRRLFNGLALVLIQSNQIPEPIEVTARAPHLPEARLRIATSHPG